MKKALLMFAIVALAASMALTSCKKPAPEPVYYPRMTTYSEDWGNGMDQWVYTYNTDGYVTKVVRNWVEAGNAILDKEWDFAWSYPKLTITGTDNYDITFGANGLVSTMTEKGDGWQETYSYSYDVNGYLVSVSRNNDLRSEIVIENGNIKSWTRFNKDDQVWQTKNHTYSHVVNFAGIHNIYSEQAGASRWLMETGYFGMPTMNLCSGNQWAHSDKASTMAYEFDTNNCVTKVVKTYDGYDEISLYTWEMVEVLLTEE